MGRICSVNMILLYVDGFVYGVGKILVSVRLYNYNDELVCKGLIVSYSIVKVSWVIFWVSYVDVISILLLGYFRVILRK